MAELVAALLATLVELGIEEGRRHVPPVGALHDELKKLERALTNIQPFLEDAHNKQFSSNLIRDWIAQVKDVFYDAEDVIDLYRVKSQTPNTNSKVRKMLSTLPLWCRNPSFVIETVKKITKINENLSEMYDQRNFDRLGLRGIESKNEQWNFDRDRETTSSALGIQIIGREKEEEQILRWVTNEVTNTTHGERTSNVIAIVGMGGLGKTTLAKKLYNNSILTNHFDKLMWVCTSEKPHKIDLFRKILEVIAGKESGADTLKVLEALILEIRKHLERKRFFLVLDDVWDFHRWWGELEGVLQVGAVGSRVLVTTRKMDVVRGMKADPFYELKGLSSAQSWDLLKAKALRCGENEDALDELKDIADVVVRKCQGVPLALSVIGSLLRNKERNRTIWKGIADSSFWDWKDTMDDYNKIVGAISISYIDLPYALKQCLTYCCIFPKDYRMKRDYLVGLWVAQGFVKSDKEELEDLAESYLEALVDCSLIQKDPDLSGGEMGYMLHDIVHDFTLAIRGEECIVDISTSARGSSLGPRFFRLMEKDLLCIQDSLIAQEKLRTIFIWGSAPINRKNFSNWIVSKFRYLRVLDLGYNRKVDKLPELLGSLVLLRHLNVSHTCIKELPESIAKLRNLQTLDISDTEIEALPEGISQLIALRHLYLDSTYKLKCLPRKIGELTRLRTLRKFIVGSEHAAGKSGSNIRQLMLLNHLRGKLRIENIERIGSREEAKQAELNNKRYLTELELRCRLDSVENLDQEFSEKMEGVYEELQPPKVLKKLKLECYAGITLPRWLRSITEYRLLEEVVLYECLDLEELPPLGSLPCLVKLEISCCRRLKRIGDEFYGVAIEGTQAAAFPKLESLGIRYMDSLEEWSFSFSQGVKIMPHLRSFKFCICPKLKMLPDDGLPLNNLTELGMRNLPELDSISLTSLKNMERLVLVGMPKLESKLRRLLEGLKDASTLKELTLVEFPDLKLEPEAMEEAFKVMNLLEHLMLKDCPKLASCVALVLKPHHLPSLRSLHITRTNYFPFCRPSPGLDEIAIAIQVDSEEMSNRLSGLVNMASRVDSLEVSLNGEVGCLPEWIQQFHQLRKLSIEGTSKVTHLPEWLGNFRELRELEFRNLSELSNLPNSTTSLTKLRDLIIYDCPKLEEWHGDVYKTISHIPNRKTAATSTD